MTTALKRTGAALLTLLMFCVLTLGASAAANTPVGVKFWKEKSDKESMANSGIDSDREASLTRQSNGTYTLTLPVKQVTKLNVTGYLTGLTIGDVTYTGTLTGEIEKGNGILTIKNLPASVLTGSDVNKSLTVTCNIQMDLSLLGENGLYINLYTILFILFFGIGYGAYYATADMPIPMVADCSDYETYRSGNYIPGIMGTLFSLVDKLVSSLSATVVGIAVSFVGLQSLPTQYDPYTPGMNWVVIVLFCIIPMVAWAATLIAMKGYTLTGAKMKEIQAVNACRRDAVAKGMKLEEAMDKWQTMEQLPAEYRS